MEATPLANPPARRSRRWLWVAVATAGGLVVILAALIAAVPLSSETLRRRLVANLSDRLDSEVELGDLHLSVFPTLHAEGTNLTVRHKNHPDEPPLISIKRFSANGGLLALMRNHVARVELTGLDIEIPPDYDDRHDKADLSPSDGQKEGKDQYRDVVIDTLVANGARLVIIPKKKHKQPKVWAIYSLTMHAVGKERSMPFDATLRNAIPPGEIETTGHFGPWNEDEPDDTPLDGKFIFDRADLSVFKGISGVLSARGTFGGTLGKIEVNGETDTPDFTLNISGHPVPLHAKYHTIVDGTNGDTVLERIDATFLKTSLVCSGSVIDAPPGVHGRIVALDVKMDLGRLEDVLRLSVDDSKPPMTGGLRMTTKFLLPPGDTDVVERLRLDGRFAIATARFTDFDVQKKINELSHRGRGRDPDQRQQGVMSNFQGRFKLVGGVLELPDLSFEVPGATVQVTGRFALRPETLNFRGTLFMDAKVSETTKGFKSLLLKVIDPLFKKKGGGSAIPIKVDGTLDKPSVGLEMGRVFKRDKGL